MLTFSELKVLLFGPKILQYHDESTKYHCISLLMFFFRILDNQYLQTLNLEQEGSFIVEVVFNVRKYYCDFQLSGINPQSLQLINGIGATVSLSTY